MKYITSAILEILLLPIYIIETLTRPTLLRQTNPQCFNP
jgi:hypothetical protein